MNGAAGKDRPSPAPRPPGVLEAGPCVAARASAGGPEPAKDPLASLLPARWRNLDDPRRQLPRLAKDPEAARLIESLLPQVPSRHDLFLGDARAAAPLDSGSVHLVVTSPPYWTLKEYPAAEGQLGWVADYEDFLDELDKVWRRCFHALVPGGRLVCVVGDVCLSRKSNRGRHTVVPLHAAIQERCRRIGFDNLAPIIWYKIANAAHEVENGRGGFLGKPYEPNAIIKNDIEFVLMQRKPGGYRRPSPAAKVLSVIPAHHHHEWFRQIWNGPAGASTRSHPAPYPSEIAERLIRMFSFAGDTVLDPFVGTGTTQAAAGKWGRSSIGIEVESAYFDAAAVRLAGRGASLFTKASVVLHRGRREAPGSTGRRGPADVTSARHE